MPYKHPNLSDQREAILWARKVIKNKHKYVILDTETTGISNKDEIIEISVIDLDGNCLLESRFLPIKRKSIPKDATDVHGISYAMLKNCPRFSDFDRELRSAIGSKDIIAYNADYDMRLYKQTCLIAYKHEGRKTFAPREISFVRCWNMLNLLAIGMLITIIIDGISFEIILIQPIIHHMAIASPP